MAKRRKYALAWVAVILIVFGSASTYAMHATSTLKFCSETCHEMGVHAEELKYSTHAKDFDGQPISCAQCHIPVDSLVDTLAVKSYSGIKDLYVHNFGDPENLDRLHMQKVARRFVSDENCLACHTDLYKNATMKEPISELGKIAHDSYLGKDGQAKSKCVGCHANVAHLPSFDKRYTMNNEFSSRIINREAYK